MDLHFKWIVSQVSYFLFSLSHKSITAWTQQCQDNSKNKQFQTPINKFV